MAVAKLFRSLPRLPILLLCVGWIAACLILTPVVMAHQGNPDYRSVINGLEPPVAGIELEVIDYDADIRLTAPAGMRVEIPGYRGEPYARILADGTVQVNARSPSAYLNTDRYGSVEVPEKADVEAPPEWETTRTDGVFQWHDHRSHWMSPEPPARLEGVNERTKVFDYEIPLLVDGRPVTIDGTLYWVGSSGGSKLPFLIGGLAVIGAGSAAVVIARRRREEPEGDERDPAEGGTGGW